MYGIEGVRYSMGDLNPQYYYTKHLTLLIPTLEKINKNNKQAIK